MAAAWEAFAPEIVDLRLLPLGDLDALLDEETEMWRRLLDWDFLASANLVRRFAGMQALDGHAMIVNRKPAGYAYFVAEERKGLLGDLFVSEPYASAENEARLLSAAIASLVRFSGVRRIESQLLMMRYPRRIPPPYADHLKIFERNFMVLDMEPEYYLRAGRAAAKVNILGWHERYQEDVSRLIAAAYRGHVDSNVNDQYRSVSGARKFLLNIIQYPGCGSFFQPASWIAWHRDTGQICGVSLTSLVAPTTGHITQICVAPGVKGGGLGYELMRNSLRSLAEHGCRKVTLTVTASNREAIRLYERIGFQTRRQFSAMVWEGF
jgi:ribosomal protein S18 acetylase RimI-like enzyme